MAYDKLKKKNMPIIAPMKPDFRGTPLSFLREVKAEIAKVSWPSREEVVKLTIVVIVISTIIGLYIGGLDLLFTKLVDLLIKR